MQVALFCYRTLIRLIITLYNRNLCRVKEESFKGPFIGLDPDFQIRGPARFLAYQPTFPFCLRREPTPIYITYSATLAGSSDSGAAQDGTIGARFGQGRIQEFILGGTNQGPQSKVKGEARIEGAKRPSIEGKARVKGASKRIEGEARTEGETREKAGGGVWGGGSVSPSPELKKITLETIHFGAYLKQLFEMTNEMV